MCGRDDIMLSHRLFCKTVASFQRREGVTITGQVHYCVWLCGGCGMEGGGIGKEQAKEDKSLRLCLHIFLNILVRRCFVTPKRDEKVERNNVNASCRKEKDKAKKQSVNMC